MPNMTIHAYTAPTTPIYPPYVNVSRDDASGEFSLTVRSRGDNGRSTGMIILTEEQLRRLARDILDAIGD